MSNSAIFEYAHCSSWHCFDYSGSQVNKPHYITSIMQLFSSHPLRSPSFEKPTFSSKHTFPESAIYCFLLQIPTSPRLLKVAADNFFLVFSSLPIFLLPLFEEYVLEYSFYVMWSIQLAFILLLCVGYYPLQRVPMLSFKYSNKRSLFESANVCKYYYFISLSLNFLSNSPSFFQERLCHTQSRKLFLCLQGHTTGSYPESL